MSKMIVPMVEILRDRSMEGIPEDFKGLSQTYEKRLHSNHKKYVQCSNTAEYNELQK